MNEFGPYLGLLTWDEAAIEIARFNERTGAAPGEKPYRLPTEDEVRNNPEEFIPPNLNPPRSMRDFRRNFLDDPNVFWCGPFKGTAGRVAGPESTFGGGSDGRIGIKHHVRLVRS